MAKYFKFLLLLFLLSTSHYTNADECFGENTNTESLISPPEQRIAFVAGNSAYDEMLGSLPNATNDARDLAQALRKLGFEVVCGLDLNRQAFINKLGEFKDRLDNLDPNGVSLFYYAGHGAQIQSNNYILPIELDVGTPDDLDNNFINLNEILKTLMEANNRHGSRFVILDACRNNPLGDGWSKPKTNFSIKGLFWAFGTGYGKKAADAIYETDNNGLYTKHILDNMFTKGATFDQIMKKVTAAVDHESDGSQIPEVGGSLVRDFMFVPGERVTINTTYEDTPLWLKSLYILAVILLILTSFVFYRYRQTTAWTRGIDLTAQLGIDKNVAEDIRRKSRLATDEIVGYVKDIADKKLVGLVTSKFDMVIGRNNNVNIVINRDSVSGEHAQLGWDKEKKEFWLEDIGSTNGTWWGKDKKLEVGTRYPLKSGELFYLADKESPMVVLAHDDE